MYDSLITLTWRGACCWYSAEVDEMHLQLMELGVDVWEADDCVRASPTDGGVAVTGGRVQAARLLEALATSPNAWHIKHTKLNYYLIILP